ncbi:MAG: MerR family transcriptional regulator [Myxococcota bacterium]
MMSSLPTVRSDPQRTEVLQCGLRIGDIAKATGKTARALRLYEEMGLLTPGQRSAGGFRLYGTEAIERVRWISQLQDLGLSLHDIQDAVSETAAEGVPRHAMARVRHLFEARLEDLTAQIERLSTLQREVSAALQYLDGCTPCRVAAKGPSACASCSEHGGAVAPALVRGVAGAAAQTHEGGIQAEKERSRVRPRPAEDNE